MTKRPTGWIRTRLLAVSGGRPALFLSWMSALWVLGSSLLSAMTAAQLESWAEGPVQWLLLPEERKALKNLDGDVEGDTFVEVFWQRRDSVPGEAGNTYRDEFIRRVEAADILYDIEGSRGALTDRGRALILMGPPSHVTVSTEPVMAWDPASDSSDRVTMRDANVEIWGYRMEDLPHGMLQIWMAKKKAAEDTLTLTLMFRNVGRRTALVEGEELLEAAVQAAVLPYED